MRTWGGLICGHCGKGLRIRSSEGPHICMRTLWLQCTNVLCGAAYRGCVEVQYQYSPSACPSPDFQLPPPPRHVIKADRRALYEQDSGGQLDLIHQIENEDEDEDEEDSTTTTTGNVE